MNRVRFRRDYRNRGRWAYDRGTICARSQQALTVRPRSLVRGGLAGLYPFVITRDFEELCALGRHRTARDGGRRQRSGRRRCLRGSMLEREAEIDSPLAQSAWLQRLAVASCTGPVAGSVKFGIRTPGRRASSPGAPSSKQDQGGDAPRRRGTAEGQFLLSNPLQALLKAPSRPGRGGVRKRQGQGGPRLLRSALSAGVAPSRGRVPVGPMVPGAGALGAGGRCTARRGVRSMSTGPPRRPLSPRDTVDRCHYRPRRNEKPRINHWHAHGRASHDLGS